MNNRKKVLKETKIKETIGKNMKKKVTKFKEEKGGNESENKIIQAYLKKKQLKIESKSEKNSNKLTWKCGEKE